MYCTNYYDVFALIHVTYGRVVKTLTINGHMHRLDNQHTKSG
jgi:hypothetical protein